MQIFDDNNNCLNDKILKDFEYFTKPSLKLVYFICIIEYYLFKNYFLNLIKDQIFNAFVTYYDKESDITYLQLNSVLKRKFDSEMANINKSFHKSNNENKYENFKESMICFALFDDEIWYRVKLLRISSSKNKVLVHFIDYGNKEIVTFENIKLIDNKYSFLKAFPSQV